MTTAPDVLALQETDQALDRARARLTDVEAQLGESEELAALRQAVAEREEVLTQLRSRLHDAEWSVDDARGKATEVERKLYGGTIRNPKELADLDADLSSLKTQVGKREDTLLSLLVEMEEAEALLGSARSTLSETEAVWQRDQAALLKEKSQLEHEIADLERRRRDQLPAVDASSLRLYQLLRERHRGQAVAGVERGMCQGCRIALPMSLLQKARSGVGLVQCVSCERILLVS
jgi:predicted  nucleic acid-binding Zn-ribbon protein